MFRAKGPQSVVTGNYFEQLRDKKLPMDSSSLLRHHFLVYSQSIQTLDKHLTASG